jgi:signal transduction histidine kinase
MSVITKRELKSSLHNDKTWLPDISGDRVLYEFDFKNEKFIFITPSIEKLTGYNIEEINKIGFKTLIVKQVDMLSSSHSFIEAGSNLNLIENVINYQIETKNGKLKWLEECSIIITDEFDNKIKRIGYLRETSEQVNEQKIKQVILEILEAANSEKNLSELFKFIHSSIQKLMKADNFYIAYYNRDSDLLTFPYFVDEVDTDSSSKKLGKGLTEYVLRTGKSALVDLKKDEELRRQGKIELVGPQSPIWLGVPLKIMSKTIGVMVLQDYSDPNTYGPSEQQILDVISFPISRAIERKILDEEREEMIVKLKELNTSKDRLFSLISHDLRTPFNSLLGFAEILRTEFENLTHKDIREYINIINDSSKTLYEMTNNLLNYSKLQLHKYDYVPQKVHLNEIINDVVESFNYRITKKDILVKSVFKDEYYIQADEEMIRVVFENVISNSIKYSNRNSLIKIFAEEVTNEESTTTIQVSVSDDGIGISEEKQKIIFSRDMISTLGTSKEPGTGLGLLIAQKFVELNKGKLEIISTEGEGTTVVLALQGL